MRRASGVLAFMAGAALTVTTTGAAIGQEESPLPDASMAPEAEMMEPSTLSIDDIAGEGMSVEQLKSKKYKKAIAKAVPIAARFAVDSAGDDAIGQIIGLSLAARAADEAGDTKTAKALLDIAKLLYRNEWTKTKSDYVALDTAIAEAIAADYPEQDPALVLHMDSEEATEAAERVAAGADPEANMVLLDICVWPDGTGFVGASTETPLCADDNGRMLRVDPSLVDMSQNFSKTFYSGDPATADIGGVGIHKVTQDGSANDKLSGKKYKKALAKVLKKSGASIAGYTADERGVIEMVLAARAADEAGDQKAAKAFMGLALLAYRSGLPKDSQTAELNAAIDALIQSEYAGLAGLELYPPEGEQDWCFNPDGTCAWLAGAPYECDQAGLVRERITPEEAVTAGCQFE